MRNQFIHFIVPIKNILPVLALFFSIEAFGAIGDACTSDSNCEPTTEKCVDGECRKRCTLGEARNCAWNELCFDGSCHLRCAFDYDSRIGSDWTVAEGNPLLIKSLFCKSDKPQCVYMRPRGGSSTVNSDLRGVTGFTFGVCVADHTTKQTELCKTFCGTGTGCNPIAGGKVRDVKWKNPSDSSGTIRTIGANGYLISCSAFCSADKYLTIADKNSGENCKETSTCNHQNNVGKNRVPHFYPFYRPPAGPDSQQVQCMNICEAYDNNSPLGVLLWKGNNNSKDPTTPFLDNANTGNFSANKSNHAVYAVCDSSSTRKRDGYGTNTGTKASTVGFSQSTTSTCTNVCPVGKEIVCDRCVPSCPDINGKRQEFTGDGRWNVRLLDEEQGQTGVDNHHTEYCKPVCDPAANEVRSTKEPYECECKTGYSLCGSPGTCEQNCPHAGQIKEGGCTLSSCKCPEGETLVTDPASPSGQKCGRTAGKITVPNTIGLPMTGGLPLRLSGIMPSSYNMQGEAAFRSVYTVGRADRPDYICWKNTETKGHDDPAHDHSKCVMMPNLLCLGKKICPTSNAQAKKCPCREPTADRGPVENTFCDYAHQDPMRLEHTGHKAQGLADSPIDVKMLSINVNVVPPH